MLIRADKSDFRQLAYCFSSSKERIGLLESSRLRVSATCEALESCPSHYYNKKQLDKLKNHDFSYTHQRNEFARRTATLKPREAGIAIETQ